MRERLEGLERDKEAVLEHYADVAPECLEALTPEERHNLYKILRVEVLVPAEGPVEVSWAYEVPRPLDASCSATTEDLHRSARTADR